ncbi:major pollen allergen Bet v 1-M/N-like [Tripterygium wilfordii]|uniref:major pollen allergen Bet v 1-M/N-like n=1 Tax=Tripterygium wilfordii TaxID=458696 RepID=UPI0018F8418B|nr:major pollen allergen Bet v 1-M/N-like [Tripterygium wilfordii]
MGVGIIVDEHVSSISVERLWKAAIVDGHNLVPKLLPNIISSIEILEGDGGVGTIKKLNFTDDVMGAQYIKDQVEVIDHEKHIFKLSIIEGGLIGIKMKSYVYEVSFTSTSEGGSLANLKIDYEPLEDAVLPSEEEINNIKLAHIAMVKAVDGYLLANPDAYA